MNRVLACVLANSCLAMGITAQDIHPRPTDGWNAINVLQAAVRAPIIDSATLATTTQALRLIRERYPNVRDIPTGPDETMLELMLSPVLSARVAPQRSAVRSKRRSVRRVGLGFGGTGLA